MIILVFKKNNTVEVHSPNDGHISTLPWRIGYRLANSWEERNVLYRIVYDMPIH